MTTYYIELNGKWVQSYSRKAYAYKWVEKFIQDTKVVDHETYPDHIKILKAEEYKELECIYEIKIDSNN